MIDDSMHSLTTSLEFGTETWEPSELFAYRKLQNQVDSARTKALKAMASMESPSNTKSVERFHESLEKIRNGTSGLMYMFGLIIFAITATTLLLWNKMRSYEKKHFL